MPRKLAHISGNKTGMLLMELRERMATDDNNCRIPLVSGREGDSKEKDVYEDIF